ncbi:MAG: type II toxin-antitoxin system VapC family toxin [bacterium]
MRAFIDTSSLFKKYVEEEGSGKFNKLLDSISDIIVSPITILEINSVIGRRVREKTLRPQDANWIEKEFLKDYSFFGIVQWNESLIKECTRIIRKYHLRVLDGIQLSAASISDAVLFITSDTRLFKTSKKEIDNVKYI